MKKILIALIVIAAVLVAGIVLTKNVIARTALVKGIKAATGLDIEVGGVQVGLLDTMVKVDNLKVFNPATFPEKVMADIPEVFVNYDLGAFFKNKVHLKEVRVNIKEINLIHDKAMKLNASSLALLAPPSGGSAAAAPEVKIDSLALKIGKVAYKNYMMGSSPKGIEFEANINEVFKDVTDPAKVAKDVLAKLLSRSGVADLAGIKDMVKKQAEDLSFGVKAMIGEAAGETAAQKPEDRSFKVTTTIDSGASGATQSPQQVIDRTIDKTQEEFKKILGQ